VRDLLPCSLHVLHLRLHTKRTLHTDLTRDFGDLGGEDGELVDHVVDLVDEVENLALDEHSLDLLREVSASNSGSSNGDGSHLQLELEIIDAVRRYPDGARVRALTLAAMTFTQSVRSLHVPPTLCT
jgi:hypothetical protein